jgi:hypothetical protein
MCEIREFSEEDAPVQLLYGEDQPSKNVVYDQCAINKN